MGQYWRIVDLTLMESLYELGKLGESIGDGFNKIVDLLRTEVEVPKTANLGPSKLANVSTWKGVGPRPKGLHDLPAEVIYMIFEQMTLEDYQDAVMFAHADAFLLKCGESRLRKLYTRRFAPCAGYRLICIGDYAADLPPTLCSSKELRRMVYALGWDLVSSMEPVFSFGDDENGTNSDDHKQSSGSLAVPEPQSNATRIEEKFDPKDAELVEKIAQATFHGTYCLEERQHRLVGFSDDQVAEVELEVEEWLEGPFKKSKNVAILRNLSKRVFVRSDTLSEMMVGTTKHGALGRVVVAHICWSTDDSISMSYDGGIHRGEWAGDAFDIVSPSKFNPAAESTGDLVWRDVTASVASTMKNIWESEFESEWQEMWRVIL